MTIREGNRMLIAAMLRYTHISYLLLFFYLTMEAEPASENSCVFNQNWKTEDICVNTAYYQCKRSLLHHRISYKTLGSYAPVLLVSSRLICPHFHSFSKRLQEEIC
jgi:hypothetical protein